MTNREYIKGEKEAKRKLRQEVAFGCPMCRKPFLFYHHFDPPWRIKHHWNPVGIVALCHEHHDKADGGHYSREYLRKLKQATYSVEDVKEQYPWERREFIVRVGGNYSGGCAIVLKVSGEEIIELKQGEEDLLFLSFHLKSKDGKTVAIMKDNAFEFGPITPYDFKTTTTATRIKLWLSHGDIGLDVSISRPNRTEFNEILEKDRKRMLAMLHKTMQNNTAWPVDNPAIDIAVDFKKIFTENFNIRSPVLQSHLQSHFSGDAVGDSVKKWAVANCMDSDGEIPFLNFESLSIYSKDRHIRLRNGIGEIYYNAFFNCGAAIHL